MLQLFLPISLLLPVIFACQILAPYNQIAVVHLDVDASHQVWGHLRALCQLRFVNDDRDDDDQHPSNGRRPGAVLLTPNQLIVAHSEIPAHAINVLTTDLAAYIRKKQKQSAQPPGTVYSSPISEPVFYFAFRPFSELVNRWKTLALVYPNSVSLEQIGNSVENRPIYLIRIGKPKAAAAHRKVLLLFGQHAREWASISSGTYIAEYLARNPPANNVQVLIVPLVNPDGYVHTHKKDRLWRKNRNPKSICPYKKDPVSGVDLNRNWGKDWGSSHTNKPTGSKDQCSNVYFGRSAFSEPEIDAIRRNIDLKNVVATLDVHAFAQLIIGAWAYTGNSPPNADVVDEMGMRLRDAASVNGARYAYGRGNSNGLYLASGVASDWFFHKGILASFTMELRPDRQDMLGFDLPEELIIPTAKDALRVVDQLIIYAHQNATNTFQINPLVIPTPKLIPSDDSQREKTDLFGETQPTSISNKSASIPLIVGGSIGGLLLAVAIIVTAFFVAKRKTRAKDAETADVGVE